MGYIGNQFYKPDLIIGCSSNIIYDITSQNTFFDTDALTEHHIDTLIYRDTLQGV